MEPVNRKSEIIAGLRQQVQHLEGYKRISSHTIVTGIPALDDALPNQSFPLAAVHEFLCDGHEDAAATNGFIVALLSNVLAQSGYAVWINKVRTVFPPGLQGFGIDPARVIFMQAARDKEALWVMEEGLRCKSLSAVIAEIPDADLTATRRLQLAVEDSGVTGFLLRHNPKKTGSSACVTRWRITALPSQLDDDLPGVGFPRWHVELLKARNGRPGQWSLEWKNNSFNLIEPKVSREEIYSPFAVAR